MGAACCASVDDKCADNEEVVKDGSREDEPSAPAARTSLKDRKPTGFITKDTLLRVVEQLAGDEDEAADPQKRVVINVDNVEFIPPGTGSHQEQTLEVPARTGKRNLTGFVPQLDIAAVDSDEGEEPVGTQRADPPRQEITDVQLFQILDDVNGREGGAGSDGGQKRGTKTGRGKPTINIDFVEVHAYHEDSPAERPSAAPKRKGKRNLTGFVKKADIEQLDREGSAEDAPPSGAAPKPGGPRVSFEGDGDGAAEGEPANGKLLARKATGISKDALLQVIDDFNDAEDGGGAVEDTTTVNITYTETVTVSAGEADQVAPKLRESHSEEFVSPHGRILARKGTGFISKQKLRELLQRGDCCDGADDGDGGDDHDDGGVDDDGKAGRSRDKVSICVEYTVFVVEDDQADRTRAGPPRKSKRQGTGFVTKAEARSAGPRVSFQEEPAEVAAAEPPAAGRAGGSVVAKLHKLIADFEEK